MIQETRPDPRTAPKGRCSPQKYRTWLDRKARAHVARDRRRGNARATRADYMRAIHEAVLRSRGRDIYTGRALAWNKISTYDNAASKARGRKYKHALADLPTVDHEGDGRGAPRFHICSWRVNDAKHDLPYEKFITLCRQVLKWNKRTRSAAV